METVNDETQLPLDEILEDEDTFVEKKTIYPIKVIITIIASLIALGVVGGLWAIYENKAHYASQEKELFQDADKTINEWVDRFDSIPTTRIVIGDPQESYAQNDLNEDLEELKRLSALKVVSMEGLEVNIEPDKSWNFTKYGEVIHEGKFTEQTFEITN